MQTLNLVVFAGGRSSRMGQDKTYLSPKDLFGQDGFSENILSQLAQKGLFSLYEGGVDLLSHALCLLNAVKEKYPDISMSIYISCREDQQSIMKERIQHLSFAHEIGFCLDVGVGVCEALASCLTLGDCLIIPCDVPCLSMSLLDRLIYSWLEHENKYAQYVFMHEKKSLIESLIGIYTRHAQKDILIAIEKKLPLQKAFSSVHHIVYSERESFSFFNLNSPKEIQELQNILSVMRS